MNRGINLKSLIDLTAELHKKVDSHEILSLVLLSLMGKLRFTRGVVYTYDKSKNEYHQQVNRSKFKEDVIQQISIFEVRPLRPKISTETIFTNAGFSFIVPILGENDILAFVLLGGRSSDLDENELYYSELIARICSTALVNAESKSTIIKSQKETEQRNLLLTTIFEMNQHFGRLFKSEEILQSLQRYIMGQLRVINFAILIYEQGEYKTAVNRLEKEIDIVKNHDSLLSIFKTEEVEDLDVNEEFIGELQAAKVQIVSPIITSDDNKGIILIGKQLNSSGFSERELNFISALSNAAGLSLDNGKYIEQYISEVTHRKSLENEMETANEIQKLLLPSRTCDSIADFSISGTSEPARYAAGDYYDFIQLPDKRLLFFIADVSGKGIPASLIMANVQAALRILANLDLPIDQLILQINDLVYQNTSADRFVTAFLGILNTKDKCLEYINAGHNAPVIIREDDSISKLDEGGLILGFMNKNCHYEIGRTSLNQDELLFLYTDGVTEALNSNTQEYGEDRLIEFLKKNKHLSTCDICNNVVDDVNKYAKDTPQYDDITVLAIKRETSNLQQIEFTG